MLATTLPTTVKVAIDPTVGESTGKYWSNEREAKPSQRSQDASGAKALYEESCKLTGVTPLPSR